jgi:hypothetical protein
MYRRVHQRETEKQRQRYSWRRRTPRSQWLDRRRSSQSEPGTDRLW